MTRRVLFARGLGLLAALAVLAVLAFAFVGDVYRVDSGSMRPTIHGGKDPLGGERSDERVLVLFGDLRELRRFDLVVLRRPGSDQAMVKRVVGLPGESVQVRGGDLWIDGRLLPPDASRPERVPLFDDRVLDVAEHFWMERAPEGPWSREGDAWRLDARAVARGSDAGLMLYHKDLRDGYLDRGGRRVPGTVEVNDAVLSAEVMVEEPGGALRLRLVEAGDTFEAVVEPGPDGNASASLTRRSARTLARPDPAERVEVLACGEVDLPPGEWRELSLSNVDDHLVLRVGAARLEAPTTGNDPYPGPTRAGERSIGARAALGGEAVHARFRRIRLARDLFYTGVGTYGVDRPVELGPGEVFVLGDNSHDSRDSRFFGPVPLERVLGRPAAVVWPLDRARRLERPVP